jgi:hypothetical protein
LTFAALLDAITTSAPSSRASVATATPLVEPGVLYQSRS